MLNEAVSIRPPMHEFVPQVHYLLHPPSRFYLYGAGWLLPKVASRVEKLEKTVGSKMLRPDYRP
jgi:hypothetical protein